MLCALLLYPCHFMHRLLRAKLPPNTNQNCRGSDCYAMSFFMHAPMTGFGAVGSAPPRSNTSPSLQAIKFWKHMSLVVMKGGVMHIAPYYATPPPPTPKRVGSLGVSCGLFTSPLHVLCCRVTRKPGTSVQGRQAYVGMGPILFPSQAVV